MNVANDSVVNVGAHQDRHGTKRAHEESSDIAKVPADSARPNIDSDVDKELSTHPLGQAAMGAPPGSDENEDLFASSAEDDEPSV